MRYDKYPESIFHLLSWVTTVILLGGLVVIQVLPLMEIQRGLLNALVVVSGGFTFVLHRYIFPRAWHRTWIFYLTTLAYISAIAVADATVYPLDLSPLYGIIIITVAVIGDLRVALFAAALASGLHFGIVLREGDPLRIGESGFYRAVVYFLTALLVSQLAQMLSERWCAAATQAETQRREIAQRQEELAGLYEISKAFDNLEDASATFYQITRRIARLLNAEICLLARYDETRACLVGMPTGYGLRDDQIRECVVALDAQTDAIWNVEEREYFFANDLTNLSPPLRAAATHLQVR